VADERTAEDREAARRAREAQRRDGLGRARLASAATPPKPHPRRNRIIALVALVVAAAVVWFAVEVFQPFHGSGHGSVTVVIPPHSSVSTVADRLAKAGVIGSSFFFEVRVTLDGDRGHLRAGTYHLKRGMSFGAVLKVLTTPPPAAPVTGVTIIPGRTRRQIDKLLRGQGVKGSYYADSRSSPLLRPVWYGARRGISSLEGFLFPDTYQLREPISIPALVADQLTDFRKQFATINFAYARSQHLTPYQVLIIASMVEAEAQSAKDRPLVASVIYNRLRLGMPLQIDATTCYLVGGEPCNLSQSKLLDSPSPYNTRIHKGLPPTPIDSPSLTAIQAAAHPAKTKDLYFVVKPCGNGAEVFTSSYQQFLRDQRQYQSARAKNGGRSPTRC
jgi:UPF0755 protein